MDMLHFFAARFDQSAVETLRHGLTRFNHTGTGPDTTIALNVIPNDVTHTDSCDELLFLWVYGT